MNPSVRPPGQVSLQLLIGRYFLPFGVLACQVLQALAALEEPLNCLHNLMSLIVERVFPKPPTPTPH